MRSKSLTVVVAAIAGLTSWQPPPVVENPAPNFRAPTFALASKPAFVIDGNVAGDSLSELYRIGDAIVTPRGGMIVVNNFGESIREYDAKGAFARVVSRKGAGPGEFSSASQLRVLDGDTLVFWDQNQRRITVLGPDRRHVRTVTGVHFPVCCSMTGVFGDHEFPPSVMGGKSYAAGPYHYAFGSLRSPGPAGQSIAFVPGTTSRVAMPGFVAAVTVVMRDKPSPMWSTYPVPFTIAPMAQFGVDELIIGTAERFEYQAFDRAGKLIRTVRAAAPPRPVTPAMRAEVRALWSKANPTYPGYAERRIAALDTLKLPATAPAYDRLFVEEDGTVWLRDYNVTDTLPRAWARFSPQGKLLGTMLVPANFTEVRFSRGHAIVALNDTTLDFRRVMVFPIVRK